MRARLTILVDAFDSQLRRFHIGGTMVQYPCRHGRIYRAIDTVAYIFRPLNSIRDDIVFDDVSAPGALFAGFDMHPRPSGGDFGCAVVFKPAGHDSMLP